MTLTNPRWADAEETVVIAESDGARVSIPAHAGNADYAALVAAGAEIAAFARWPDLAAARAELVAAVKAEANRRILARFPEWKQRNATAHMVELIAKQTLFEGQLTPAEDDEFDAIEAAWGAVKAIRAASDAKEAEIAALADLAVAEAYDVAAGWPAASR